ncbi:MAG: hypothetical protein WD426_11010 [Anditalea sp.]
MKIPIVFPIINIAGRWPDHNQGFEQIRTLVSSKQPDHHQLRPADPRGVCAGHRRDEGALFEPLVVDHKAPVLPVQELEKVPAPVEEHVHLPRGRILAHGVPYQSAQAVKALPHVDRGAVEVITVGGAQAEHQ